MAVLTEGTSVVVSNAALDRRFPGGTQGFAEYCRDLRYCSDGKLSVLCFTVPDDAALFTRGLATYGFSDPWRDSAEDIAVAVGDEGFVTHCEWLSIDRVAVPDSEEWATEVTVVRLVDETLTAFSAPAGWRPSSGHRMLSVDELERDYERVREDPVGDNGVRLIVYRHRRTGRALYVPRPRVPTDPDTARLIRLRDEFWEVKALPSSRRRDERLAAIYEESTRSVQSIGGSDPAWLELWAGAAMLTSHWKSAEQALRRLTQIRPEMVEGWLDLTMVLAAKLDRIDEAEAVARQAVEVDPNCAGAYGNLANVLATQGKTEAAMRAINRALALDPSDLAIQHTHRRLLARISDENTQSSTPNTDDDATDTPAGTPWYKRVFRRSSEGR